MNEHRRNEVIARNEDNALNTYLDSRDSVESIENLNEPCEVCEEEEGTIEYGNKQLCQSCYENAIEQAEMRLEER